MKKTAMFILSLFVLVGCQSKDDGGFSKVHSHATVKIDNIDGMDSYFLYYSFDVANKSDEYLTFYIDIMPDDESIKKALGDSYRAERFDGGDGPQSFTVEAKDEKSLGFTVSIPKKGLSEQEAKKKVQKFHYAFTSDTHRAEYEQ